LIKTTKKNIHTIEMKYETDKITNPQDVVSILASFNLGNAETHLKQK